MINIGPEALISSLPSFRLARRVLAFSVACALAAALTAQAQSLHCPPNEPGWPTIFEYEDHPAYAAYWLHGAGRSHVQKLGVLGAGMKGAGIACVSAKAGRRDRALL